MAKKNNKADQKVSASKSSTAQAKKATEKKAKGAKPSFFARIKAYFASIRSELRRVVWPSRKDLINYSVTVVIALIVVGLVVAGVDAVISGGLFALSSL